MHGGFPAALERNAAFFKKWRLSPKASGIAVDLGAGCGFQSIPLANLGYSVTAIDLDRGLLKELKENANGMSIKAIEDDLLRFRSHVREDVELVVCMTDTLLHLESKKDVRRLFIGVIDALSTNGKLIISFRDLTNELTDLDRFIPVRSDPDIVFTCFLEYEPEHVRIHDLIYRRAGDAWEFDRSFYRKLRLSPDWVTGELRAVGFANVGAQSAEGLVTIVAERQS